MCLKNPTVGLHVEIYVNIVAPAHATVTVFSERELSLYVVVCLSVTFVHPTQVIEIFGNL